MESYFSKLWNVKLGDFGRGLVVAVVAVPLQIVYESVTSVPMVLSFNWKAMGGAALAGGVGYIVKNLMTGVNGKLLSNKEPEKKEGV